MSTAKLEKKLKEPWRRCLQGSFNFFSPGVLAALCSLLLGIIWAFSIKPLDAPDEIAHLQTIMEVRNGRLLPETHYDFSNRDGKGDQVIGTPGDESVRQYARKQGYLEPLVNVPYESMQPPLYYLMAGFAAKTLPYDPEAVLYLSRLIAVLFGVGMVYFCWAAGMQLAPRAPKWVLAATGIVVLLPQFCFNSATAANDSAVNFFITASFYVWIRSLREPDYDRWMVRSGALLGLALLSKLTASALIPGLLLVILFRAFQTGYGLAQCKELLARGGRMLLGASVAALALSGWWFVRNIIAYGEFTGSQDALRYYTARGQSLLLDFGSARIRELFFQWTWTSLWGRFGWMHITLPGALYQQADLLSVSLVMLTGFALLRTRRRWMAEGRHIPAYAWQIALAMSAVGIIVVAAYVQFSIKVALQPQGRYLFALLLPASLLCTGGVYVLPQSRPIKTILLATPLVWLAFVNFVGVMMVSSIR